mmetsp:Transcript_3581/g.3073  ORF Transcript_3581/g.3073 Transcript_3581/m.3073 type:complete len:1051 (+) Transcript_3581:78-3230(+)
MNPQPIQYNYGYSTEHSRLTIQQQTSMKQAPKQSEATIEEASCKHILPNFKYRDCVINGFDKFVQSYNLSVCKRDDIYHDKLDRILYTEGCAICLQTALKSPYNDNNNNECNNTKNANEKKHVQDKENMKIKKLDEEFEDLSLSSNNADDRYSFIIIQCPSLKCQHILHNQCVLHAFNNVVMRPNHCPYFFQTVDLSHLTNKEIQREIGYHIDKNDVTDNIYHFSFKINHLISNQKVVSPQWPVTIPSYYQINDKTNEKQEVIQIFFDNTELAVFRGTISIAVVTENGMNQKPKGNGNKNINVRFQDNDPNNKENVLLANANFEIPYPFIKDERNKKNIFADPMDNKISNKIYQLRYTDAQTGNLLIINVNMKLKPDFELQLLSLRYEFGNGDKERDDDNNSVASTDCISYNSDYSGATKYIDSLPIGSVITIPDQDSTNPNPVNENKNPNTSDVISHEISPHYYGISPMFSSSVPAGQQTHIGSISPAAIQSSPVSTSVPAATLTGATIPMSSTSPAAQVPVSIPFTVQLIPTLNTIQSYPTMNSMQTMPIQTVPLVQTLPNDNMTRNNNITNNFITNNYTTTNNIIYNDTTFLNLYSNGHALYQYACSEIGSGYIAQMIKNPVYFGIFFENILKYFPELMINCMGHTVCRALYSQSHCTLSNKLMLLNSILPKFASIASSRQGSFAVICIMSLMNTNEEIAVLAKGFMDTMHCIYDKNSNKNNIGNKEETEGDQGTLCGDNKTHFDDIILSQSGYHVIKKFIGFGYPHFNCILSGISKDFPKYATHHYGVPIIRSIFDTISSNDKLVTEYTPFLQLFAQHTHCLICNQYGNYVIQQLLEISPICVTDTIKEFMLTKYSDYSKHKFASNVVEKCLEHTLKEIKENKGYGKRNWIILIVRELLYDASELINHKFGNYCLQTALSVVIKVCEEEEEQDDDDNIYRKMKIKIMPLLKEFIYTLYPLLNVLRLNVKKKWQLLLQSATRYYDGKLNIDFMTSYKQINDNNDNDFDNNYCFDQQYDGNNYYYSNYHNNEYIENDQRGYKNRDYYY